MKRSGRKRLSYYVALLALAAGVLAGGATGDWSWFSRSGSFVVVIGILLTSTQIIEHDRRLRQRRLKWEAQIRRDVRVHTVELNPSRRDWAHETQSESMTRSRMLTEDAWKREHDGLYLLVFGTLIWGFGDLVGRLSFL